MTLAAAPAVPRYIVEWVRLLQPRSFAEAVPDARAGAVFSADMVVGFCKTGSLASPRVGALTQPVLETFRRAYAHGIRHFVLFQDTHEPRALEFGSFPVHCVRGTHEAETIPELKELPFAGDFTVVEKNSLHPAISTGFDGWLDAHPEVRTAIVVGDCTDLCVYQLAMHLRLRANALNIEGFQVMVPAQAVDTYDLPEETAAGVGATPHPGDFFHPVFLYHLAFNGVQVVSELQ